MRQVSVRPVRPSGWVFLLPALNHQLFSFIKCWFCVLSPLVLVVVHLLLLPDRRTAVVCPFSWDLPCCTEDRGPPCNHGSHGYECRCVQVCRCMGDQFIEPLPQRVGIRMGWTRSSDWNSNPGVFRIGGTDQGRAELTPFPSLCYVYNFIVSAVSPSISSRPREPGVAWRRNAWAGIVIGRRSNGTKGPRTPSAERSLPELFASSRSQLVRAATRVGIPASAWPSWRGRRPTCP